MEKKTTIWHTPKEEPSVFRSYKILVMYEAGDEPEIMLSTEYARKCKDRIINRWCYWDDFIKSVDATSKALDVAIDALKEIVPEHEGLAGEMFACSGIASRALQKVEKIMKGGK